MTGTLTPPNTLDPQNPRFPSPPRLAYPPSVKSIALLLAALLTSTPAFAANPSTGSGQGKPNFIVIFCDDLGYGDVIEEIDWSVGQRNAESHDPPLLFHLGHDPSEKHNIAKQNAAAITKLTKLAESHRSSIKPVENQLEKRLPK